jgi:hypothetical protein
LDAPKPCWAKASVILAKFWNTIALNQEKFWPWPKVEEMSMDFSRKLLLAE